MIRVLAISLALVGFTAASAVAEDKVDFAKQIQPILSENCAKCHGEKRASGKLRMHTAAALKEKWDTEKGLIVAGKPEESELYKRLVLPKDDKKRMPKGGEPLAKDKIELIAKWIKQGAVLPAIAAVAATPASPPKPADAAAAPKKEEPKKPTEVPLPKVSPAPKEAVDKLTATGAQVMPLFAESSLLQVSFAHRGSPAGDPEIALLAGVADQVYALNLADSKPTDAGFAPVAKLKNLATLHMERSSATDAALAHLAALPNLQYLNLYGTGITDAGLKSLKGLKNLRRLYLWQTKASYDAAMALEKDIPGLEVNLGYNHPVVMKMRLTKELEGAKKQAEEAKAAQAKAQAELDTAKKSAEAATARQADIEKQIKDAEAAASGKPVEPAKPVAATPVAAAKPDAAAKADAKKADPTKPAKKKRKSKAAIAAGEKKPADEAKAAAAVKAAAEAKSEKK